MDLSNLPISDHLLTQIKKDSHKHVTQQFEMQMNSQKTASGLGLTEIEKDIEVESQMDDIDRQIEMLKRKKQAIAAGKAFEPSTLEPN